MVDQKVCPWQRGSFITASWRKLLHNPNRIVKPYLSKGMTAMDIGCGMGYFTIPMAGITEKYGKVIAVDLQPEMLSGLEKNAQKSGVDNITIHQCAYDSLNIQQWDDSVDFVLVMMMLHEVPDADRLIREVYRVLTQGGKMLFSEPIVHVSKKKFQSSISMIEQAGFNIVSSTKVNLCRSMVFQKEIC